MAIASAVVIPNEEEKVRELSLELDSLEGVEVQGNGPKGIALVLERKNTRDLKKLSEVIRSMDDVLDFQVAYINWE
jgi:nitrate reductase NapAB chaperone NapD